MIAVGTWVNYKSLKNSQVMEVSQDYTGGKYIYIRSIGTSGEGLPTRKEYLTIKKRD